MNVYAGALAAGLASMTVTRGQGRTTLVPPTQTMEGIWVAGGPLDYPNNIVPAENDGGVVCVESVDGGFVVCNPWSIGLTNFHTAVVIKRDNPRVYRLRAYNAYYSVSSRANRATTV